MSRVARNVRFADVEALVTLAATRNAANGLTGVLVYTPSHFIQVLEGDQETIDHTVERIRRDPRHSELRIVDSRDVTARAFASWAMVARQLHGVKAEELNRLDGAKALELLAVAADPTRRANLPST